MAAASQQTGSGIAPATVLKTGSTLDFTDGTNAFTYTSAAGDTLNTLATAINGNANFSATIAGNSLVVTAKSGQAVTFSANTLTDAAAGTETEAFAISGTAQQAGTFSTPVTVYDALGGTHVLTATFTKTASNTWNYALTIPATDVGQTGNPVTVKSGTMTFNGNGQLTSPTGTRPCRHQQLGGRRQQPGPQLESDGSDRQRLAHSGFRSFFHLFDANRRIFQRLAANLFGGQRWNHPGSIQQRRNAGSRTTRSGLVHQLCKVC